MQYRREIDGLRAIAVLPVIFFHAGISQFSGGFVGVDVFFVISGYLITGILIGDLEKGRFSIASFYERRARRILPALFTVMLACVPLAWLYMLPSQFDDFAKSLVAVTFFVSNILFWRESGYFAEAAELKPLLHTWSLAVEEQYYLFFPLLLAFLWKYGRNRAFLSITILAAISLALCEWGWRTNPSPNFYLAPTRGWELLIGSLTAFHLTKHGQGSCNIRAGVGMALVVFSIFAFDEKTPFPSLYALAPVIGTALIIAFADKDTVVAKLLSTPPFVGIGLISYSAYLWHQPLLAFARLRSPGETSPAELTLVAMMALPLAWLTWRYIEAPFRRKPVALPATRQGVFVLSAAVGAVFVLAGLLIHLSQGNPTGKFDKRTIALIESMEGMNHTWDNKIELRLAAFPDNDRDNILVIGDSNSGDLLNALIAAFGERYNYSSVTIEVGCGNLYLPRSAFAGEADAKGLSQCLSSDTFDTAGPLIRQADHVFLAASWKRFEASHFADSWEKLNRDFGPKFFVFGAKNIRFSKNRLYATQFQDIPALTFAADPEKIANNSVIEAVAGDRYINPWPMLCKGTQCPFMVAGQPVYYDGSHVTVHGAELMAAWLKPWGETWLAKKRT